MLYPVGDGTRETFLRDWYIPLPGGKFGYWRGSYYHSGDDLNKKTGGNTDLGEKLLAVADGEIVGIDTKSTTGFGKQIFLKFVINGRTYYAMYAHCQDIYVKTGDKVKAGQVIGTLGNSGTKFAHLHFSIKNTANGMDNVPNTKEELKQWESPIDFIEAHYQVKEGQAMDCLLPKTEENTKLFEKLVSNSSKSDNLVKDLGLGDKADDISYETIKRSIDARIGNADALRSKLSASEQEVENRIEQVSRLESKLTRQAELHKAELIALKEAQIKPEEIAEQYESTITALEKQLDKASKEKGKSLIELAEAKAKIESLQKGYSNASAFERVIRWIKEIWKS